MKKLSAYIYPPTILQRAKYSIDGTSLPQSITRTSLLFYYLYSCFRQWAIPWNYFQLNSSYFNASKGIFSKLELDDHIPRRWRLNQRPYNPAEKPKSYPVFLKPEWGQNSNGIICVHNAQEYDRLKKTIDRHGMSYITQDAATGKKEFEIYYLRSPENNEGFSFLSITQVLNGSEEQYPINSIYNTATDYLDITGFYSKKDLHKIWSFARDIGDFRMARIGVKADSRKALSEGDFQIVEINLFLPMPLVLLSKNVQRREKFNIIRKTMTIAAKLVKKIPREETASWIFFRKMKAHYKIAR